jgi:hypothetical protein
VPAGSPSHRALLAQEETEALIRREGLASAEALLDWYIRYEFPPDALLTVAASDRTQREVADFWTKLGNLHQRRTGRPLRTGAVIAASRYGLPHLHAVPQHPEHLDYPLLRKVARACGYVLKLTDPTAEPPGRDAREYVAGHLKRTRFRKVKPELILCDGIRTNLSRTDAERALRRERRRRQRARRSGRRYQLPPLASGRHQLTGLRLTGLDVREWRHGLYPRTTFVSTFRDREGRWYRWNGTNATPINLRGYRYPGRYPALPGVALDFAATVRRTLGDGTVVISRPYIRLDRQPEQTRHEYARECGIPLGELGLESA